MIEDPGQVLGDLGVDAGQAGLAAALRPEGDDAEEVVARARVTLGLDLDQRPTRVAAARVLPNPASHAELLRT